MKKELYLFIVWQNARFMEKYIVGDIKKKFELFQIYEINWSEKNFAANIARFYGKKLPNGYKKEKETGSGSFLALLVYDRSPQFSEGRNIAITTAKSNYTHMIGNNLVHASNNLEETNEDLLFLFGKNVKEIEQEEAFFIPRKYNKDIVGCPIWQTTDEALDIVRKIPFTKVTKHKESFLIHSRYADTARRILNATSQFKFPGRHKYFISVGKSKQPIYIRKIS